jgi:hypothetical protein
MMDDDRQRYIVRSPWLGVRQATIEPERLTPWGLIIGPELVITIVLVALINSTSWGAGALVAWIPVWVVIAVRRANRRERAEQAPREPTQATWSDRR